MKISTILITSGIVRVLRWEVKLIEVYKRDCFYYDEAQDMGAPISTCCCKINKQGLGWCKCEKCHWYISKTEAKKVVRNYMIDKLWGEEGNL